MAIKNRIHTNNNLFIENKISKWNGFNKFDEEIIKTES